MENRAPLINWIVFALSLALCLKVSESGLMITTASYWATFTGGVIIHALIAVVVWPLLDRIEPGAGKYSRTIAISFNAAAFQGAAMAVVIAIISMILRLIF